MFRTRDELRVFEGNKELIHCIDTIKQLKRRIGVIVMNCNPFTLGHRFLIEEALKNVDLLYVFVVEENVSRFSFTHRINMVREGTNDLADVEVLPSGKLMISAQTFPGYFYKESPTNVFVDTSTDVEIFAQHIVPLLGVDVRFVGEEPFDLITRQYNNTIKEILPCYGVEVIEIPRKKVSEQIISATVVRKALDHKNFETVKKMVPETTLEYILKNNL